MSSIPAESYSAVAGTAPGLPSQTGPDPDNPPWGLKTAFLTWLGSVGLLLGISMFSSIIALLYVLSTYGSVKGEELTRLIMSDKLAVLIQVSGVIPVHLLTLVLVWFVITNRGKRPFWRTLGWRFNNWWEPLLSVMMAVGLLAFGAELTRRYGGDPTDIDQIINSSAASRLVLAFLATATAPLVEEIVYRGILYPALQRAIGVAWAVVAVSILFMAVHIAQYYNNISVIAAIGVLSLALTLVRAYTKSLLPCFIIHLVFNGLQSLYIIFHPYITGPEAAPTQKTGVVIVGHILGAGLM
ncbi:MAG TPA: CPBP family intramembrane glutamic endopeptidase [Pyrinomonadaceae bacterium]|nr:CPBP family intramembrane glutamic endopeptidase [Pyrinomonadaceae bacterium]